MTLIRRILSRMHREPPLIMTQWGPVTETARLQAALNMRADEELRHMVEEMVIRDHRRGIAAGLIECRRRYPEAYQ
jgi:hypothetical protein